MQSRGAWGADSSEELQADARVPWGLITALTDGLGVSLSLSHSEAQRQWRCFCGIQGEDDGPKVSRKRPGAPVSLAPPGPSPRGCPCHQPGSSGQRTSKELSVSLEAGGSEKAPGASGWGCVDVWSSVGKASPSDSGASSRDISLGLAWQVWVGGLKRWGLRLLRASLVCYLLCLS